MPARLTALAESPGGFLHFLVQPPIAAIVHVGFFQLAFNLAALIVCGRIVESIVGGAGLLLVFLIGAYAAAVAYYLIDPNSTTALIGAGGAVSAVIGAYAMLAGRLRAKLASPILARTINVVWLGATWLILQGLVALTLAPVKVTTLAPVAVSIGIAANLGGFLVGLLLARPLLLWRWRGA